jgi:hypothetical protein
VVLDDLLHPIRPDRGPRKTAQINDRFGVPKNNFVSPFEVPSAFLQEARERLLGHA